MLALTQTIMGNEVFGEIFDGHEDQPLMAIETVADLNILFEKLSYREGVNDLWITAGDIIKARIHGEIRMLTDLPVVPEKVLNPWIDSVCGTAWKFNVDSSYQVMNQDASRKTRYRINVYTERGKLRVCARLINNVIPDAQALGMPKRVIESATTVKDGLIFFTGVTGSGKSTSIAALLDLRSRLKSEHILTLEDPIETEFVDSSSFFSQREKGRDFVDFPNGLSNALRESPNTMLIGEIRDGETAEIALHAAETGHLVFATLHTKRAAHAVARYALMFPPEQQDEVYKLLADLLRVVVCQKLIPAVGGGRVALLELMDNPEGSSIRSLLAQGKIAAVTNSMSNSGDTQSFTFEQHLELLYKQNKIAINVYNEMKNILKGSTAK
jgi:twitching motility protein PilT